MAHKPRVKRFIGEKCQSSIDVRSFMFEGDWSPIELFESEHVPRLGDTHPGSLTGRWKAYEIHSLQSFPGLWQVDCMYAHEVRAEESAGVAWVMM